MMPLSISPSVVGEKNTTIDEKIVPTSSSSSSSTTTWTITPTLNHIENILSERRPQPVTHTPPSSDPSVSAEGNNFFDLRPPPALLENQETRVEGMIRRLFSEDHLNFVLNDRQYLSQLTSFLNRYRPHLIPVLTRYIEMRKAMKAIEYANSVARNIRWPTLSDQQKFSRIEVAQTDVRFEDYTSRDVDIVISDALQPWITYQLVNIVNDCVSRDITGQSLPILKELIGSLGEIFCLTDPSQDDNPIIFCSEGQLVS